jgi:hypothetical protein
VIEQLSDIIDQLADQIGVYGAHDDENDEACQHKPCRVCWTSELWDRIHAAVELEQQLARGMRESHTLVDKTKQKEEQ